MLTVATDERVPEYPDLPTFRELGYDFVTLTLSGIVGPKGIPKSVVEKLTKALVKARKDPRYVKTMETVRTLPRTEVGEEYKARVMDIYKRVAEYKDIK